MEQFTIRRMEDAGHREGAGRGQENRRSDGAVQSDCEADESDLNDALSEVEHERFKLWNFDADRH